jgi:catechol-2,3-dioxygenase
MSVNPVALSGAHMETRSITETIPVLTDLLGLQIQERGSTWVTLKHPNTSWLMTVHDAGSDATLKASENHYGVRVLSKQEVDAAYTHLQAHAVEYGLTGIRPPENQHGSYSVYFVEPGTNTLEIECYEDVNRKDSVAERLGGVRGPHWQQPLSPESFPGRGYVPQALTHGTLAIDDSATSRRFYEEVLGLDVHNAYGDGRVMYIKHPDTKHFIVCARRAERHRNPPTFRYTLTLASAADVAAAHQWVRDHQQEFAIAEVQDIVEAGSTCSFVIRDPDLNWWEITAKDSPAGSREQ